MATVRESARVQAPIEVHGDVCGAILDGNFEASLLLLGEQWDEHLVELAPNVCAAAVPARDILGFIDVDAASGIEALRELVTRVFQNGDYAIAAGLYHREAGKRIVHQRCRQSAKRSPPFDPFSTTPRRRLCDRWAVR